MGMNLWVGAYFLNNAQRLIVRELELLADFGSTPLFTVLHSSQNGQRFAGYVRIDILVLEPLQLLVIEQRMSG